MFLFPQLYSFFLSSFFLSSLDIQLDVLLDLSRTFSSSEDFVWQQHKGSTMESNAAMTTSEYVLWLLFRCLSLTPTDIANPAFALALSNDSVVETIFLDSSLEFVPGLLEWKRSLQSILLFDLLPCLCHSTEI